MQGSHFGFACRGGLAYLDGMAEPSYVSRPCPICGKPSAERFRPFCSGRCKDVDLNRWFKGAYAIPAAESADDSGEQERADTRERTRDKESG
jgi:endogenous inhibitor of DNA gyrase (YacG/DUF329 family)